MLFAANRWEKAPIINRQRSMGKTVIINRYSESNIVYGAANGLSIEWLMALEQGLPRSDAVVVLDAPALGLASRRRRMPDSYEKNLMLQERARELYRRLAQRFGWNIINATGDREVVHKSIVEVLEQRVNLGARTKRH